MKNNNQFVYTRPKRCFVFWLCGLICLIFGFIFLLHTQIGFMVFAFVLGIVLEYIAISILKKTEKQFWDFISETSIFTHPTQTPMTPAKIAETLKQNFFSVTAYAFENYHAVQTFSDGYECHFFLFNVNTPDCKEAEPFSMFFIQKVLKIGQNSKKFYICMDIGNLSEKSSTDWETLRKGIILSTKGNMLCWQMAYDVQKQILYFADALLHVKWRTRDVIPKHMCDVITQVCKPYCNLDDTNHT